MTLASTLDSWVLPEQVSLGLPSANGVASLASNRTKIHKAIVAIINFMTDGLLEDELREYAIYTQDCIEGPYGAYDLSPEFLEFLSSIEWFFLTSLIRRNLLAWTARHYWTI